MGYAEAVPVQKLVEQGVKHVPSEYIREFPLASGASEELRIPVIDLSNAAAHATPGGRSSIIHEIQHACEQWGFFHVVGHGIPDEVLQGMLQSTTAFFDLPFEKKMEFYAESTGNPKISRYGLRYDDVSVADWRDFLIFGRCFPATEEVVNLWPKNPPSYRAAVRKYCDELRQLGLNLLSLISESLGLRPDRLEENLDKDGLILLCNRYMACPQPELVLGVRNHSDPNTITVLMENKVPGLEVLHGKAWVPVHPVPGSLIVNVGDHLEIMSNGRYKSVEHRGLTNRESTRLSIAGFFNPPFDEAVVSPLPELLDEEHQPLYKAGTYRDYVKLFHGKSAGSKDTIKAVSISSEIN